MKMILPRWSTENHKTVFLILNPWQFQHLYELSTRLFLNAVWMFLVLIEENSQINEVQHFDYTNLYNP